MRTTWAKWYPFHRCSDGPELYVDSDIIALGDCQQIKHWARNESPSKPCEQDAMPRERIPTILCSLECNSGRGHYGEWKQLLHTEKPWNAGLVGQRGSFDLATELRSWHCVNRTLFGQASSRAEQAAVAACAEAQGAEPLDPKRYIICSPVQNNGLERIDDLDTIHFTCGKRNRNWFRLLPRIEQMVCG